MEYLAKLFSFGTKTSSSKKIISNFSLKTLVVYIAYIVISYFYVLTIGFNLGIFLYIPFFIYIATTDFKGATLSAVSLLAISYLAGYHELISITVTLTLTAGLFHLLANKTNPLSPQNIAISISVGLISYATISTFSYEDDYIFNMIVIGVITGVKTFFLQMLHHQNTTTNKKHIFYYYELIAIYILIFTWTLGLTFVTTYDLVNVGLISAIFWIILFAHLTDTSFHFLLAISFFYAFTYMLKIESAILFPVISFIYFSLKHRSFLLKATLHLLVIVLLYYLRLSSDYYGTVLLENVIAVTLFFVVYELTLKNSKYQRVVTKDANINATNIEREVIEQVSTKLLNYSELLNLFAKKAIATTEELTAINEQVEQIKYRYCASCPKKIQCHQNNTAKTYHYLGTISTNDNLDNYHQNRSFYKRFEQYCIKSSQIFQYLKQQHFKPTKLSVQMKNKLVLKGQIESMSEIIKQYAMTIEQNNLSQETVIEKLRNRLTLLGLEVIYIKKLSSKITHINLEIALEPVNSKKIIEQLNKHIATVLGDDLHIEFVNASRKYGMDIIKLRSKQRYVCKIGVSYVGKKGSRISGDNYLKQDLPDGNVIVALSDGMGSGYKAFHESKTMLELLETMLQTSSNTSTVIATINSLLSLREYHEQYSSLDYCLFDKISGEALFYKIGSAPSFIVGNNVQKIDNQSLPVGITQEFESQTKKIRPGETIVLVTDGVTERIKNLDAFEQFLKNNNHLLPQELAHAIIRYSTKAQNGTIPDDMMAITLRISSVK